MILTVPSTMGAGFVGDPYTADNINVFDDLNWPPVDSGLLSMGQDLLTGLGDLPSFDSTFGGSTDTGGGTLTFPYVVDPGPPDLNVGSGQWYTANGITTPSTVPSTGSPMTAAQIAALIGGAGAAAGTAIKATQTPYVIPGTSAIYNPATGQISGAAGFSTATTLTSLTSLMPILLIGGLALLVLKGGR